jgi:hypothetical protein
MKNSKDKECEMEERLKYICGLVNDWLKFAEAKNAALVVAVCAVIVIVADHSPALTDSACIRWSCFVGCGFLVFAGGVSLASFIPVLTFRWHESKKERSASHNLMYFEHIAAFSAFELLEALYQSDGQPCSNRKIEADLAGQAVINAKIASRKFFQFKVATCFALIGFTGLGLSACLKFWK